MRAHWQSCITHFDEHVGQFIAEYFADANRRCLLVAGAGFDPRACLVAERLAAALGDRLEALLIREDRLNPAAYLLGAANENERKLRALIATCRVEHIPVFASDGAPIAGLRVAHLLHDMTWPGITDIVLDLSALSIGVSFPTARILLQHCETSAAVNFHLMVSSNPELDASIAAEPSAQSTVVRGFSGPSVSSETLPVARIWLPHLAPGKRLVLDKIKAGIDRYKVCPVLPFPARNPRRADALLAEYQEALADEWQVGAQDLIYVSERNPLDSYRTIKTLKSRFDRSVEDVYTPQMILSPVGSKVMAAGALMAAIEYDLVVQHVETQRYELGSGSPTSPQSEDMIVHVWLHGHVYAGYGVSKPKKVA